MQDYFYSLADAIAARLKAGEGFLANYSGERSEFVRFNRSAVRQPGTVSQGYLSIELFRGKRHASASISVTETPDEDIARIESAVTGLRDMLTSAEDDPHFLVNTAPLSSTHTTPDRLP